MTLEELAAQAPLFIKQTAAMISGPKRFISSIDEQAPDTLRNALIYYVLAVAVSLALELPFTNREGEFGDHLPTAALVLVLGVLLSSALLTGIWRLMGGLGGYQRYLIVTLYIWGVGVLIWAVGALMAKGLMMVQAPSLFPDYLEYMQLLLTNSASINDPKFTALNDSDAMLSAMLFFAAVQVVLIGWFVFSWSTYRAINRLSATRAALAMMLYLLCLYPLSKIFQLAQHAAGVTLF
jgi:hypothetical protein